MNPLRHTFISRCRASVSSSSTSSSLTFQSPPQSKTHPGDGQGTGLRYLDIGCGGGIFAESAARLSNTLSVTAIDPTPEVIKVAQRHLLSDPALSASGKLRYLNCAIEDLPAPSFNSQLSDPKKVESKILSGLDGIKDGVDVLSLFEVIEHVTHPSPFLEKCMKHVKPGGWLVGSTIARTWTSWFTTKLMAEEVMRVVPRGTHEWSQYIQPEEMRGWLDGRKGWGDWRCMGVVYLPGLGWREVQGSEGWGNYFFAVRKEE